MTAAACVVGAWIAGRVEAIGSVRTSNDAPSADRAVKLTLATPSAPVETREGTPEPLAVSESSTSGTGTPEAERMRIVAVPCSPTRSFAGALISTRYGPW